MSIAEFRKKVPRQVMLVVSASNILLMGALVLGWSGMQLIFDEDGEYTELCDAAASQTRNTTSNATSGAINEEDLLTCDERVLRINFMYVLAQVALLSSSLACGALLDRSSPRTLMTLSNACVALGAAVVATSNSRTFDVFAYGFTILSFFGPGLQLAAASVANLFPGHESTVIGVLSGMMGGSAVVLPVYAAIGRATGAGMSVLFGTHAILALAFTASAWLLFPDAPYASPPAPVKEAVATHAHCTGDAACGAGRDVEAGATARELELPVWDESDGSSYEPAPAGAEPCVEGKLDHSNVPEAAAAAEAAAAGEAGEAELDVAVADDGEAGSLNAGPVPAPLGLSVDDIECDGKATPATTPAMTPATAPTTTTSTTTPLAIPTATPSSRRSTAPLLEDEDGGKRDDAGTHTGGVGEHGEGEVDLERPPSPAEADHKDAAPSEPRLTEPKLTSGGMARKLRRTVLARPWAALTAFFVLHYFRLSFYLGSVSVQLDDLADSEAEAKDYLSLFGWVAPFGSLAAPLIGRLYDSRGPRAAMIIVHVAALLHLIVVMIPVVEIQPIAFALYTTQQEAFFAVALAYLLKRWGIRTFGSLAGILFLSGALSVALVNPVLALVLGPFGGSFLPVYAFLFVCHLGASVYVRQM